MRADDTRIFFQRVIVNPDRPDWSFRASQNAIYAAHHGLIYIWESHVDCWFVLFVGFKLAVIMLEVVSVRCDATFYYVFRIAVLDEEVANGYEATSCSGPIRRYSQGTLNFRV